MGEENDEKLVMKRLLRVSEWVGVWVGAGGWVGGWVGREHAATYSRVSA